MRRPTLVAVAHGSADPAAQQTVRALLVAVRDLVDAPVAEAYLHAGEPDLGTALAAAGRSAVVVPLLLSGGYHLFSDVLPAATAAGDHLAPPLGPDPALTAVLSDRLAESGAPADTPVVLAAAGSSDPPAVADVQAQADLLDAHWPGPVVTVDASGGAPAVDQAVARLLVRSARPVAVASYLLAPGRFADRLAGAAASWVAAPLGPHPAVARLIAERYHAAIAVTVG